MPHQHRDPQQRKDLSWTSSQSASSPTTSNASRPFWEQLTGLPVTRPVPVFAELRTPTGTIAIGAPATVAMLGNVAPVPGQNRSVFVELRVDDVDATWERIKGLVPQTIPEIVLEPADMPWGNRSVILRDPDGGLVNLFTPVTPEAKAKYGL